MLWELLAAHGCLRPLEQAVNWRRPVLEEALAGDTLVSKSRKYTSGRLRHRSPVPEIHTLAPEPNGAAGAKASGKCHLYLAHKSLCQATGHARLNIFCISCVPEVHAIAACPQAANRATQLEQS